MRITVARLRAIIAEVLVSWSKGISDDPPYDRPIERTSSFDNPLFDDELAPHLDDQGDAWGPVPPVHDDPRPIPDPYVDDASVYQPSPWIRPR